MASKTSTESSTHRTSGIIRLLRSNTSSRKPSGTPLKHQVKTSAPPGIKVGTDLNAVDSTISSGPTPGTRLTASLSDLLTTIVVETRGRSHARRPRTPTCRAAGIETDFLKFEIYDYPRRNDSQGSNSTQSTNTWRMSRSIVSGDFNNSIARTGSGYSDKFSALTQVTWDFLNIRLLIWKIQKRGSTRSPLGIKKQNSSSQLVRLRFFSSDSLKILDPHSLR